jgi:hypothetical protein
MKSSLVRTGLAALAMLSAATSAAAQEPADSAVRARRATVHLLPSVSSMDFSIVGSRPGDGGIVSAFGESRAYGLAVEVATPVRGVDLRLGVSTARPLLHEDRGIGSPAEITRARLSTFNLDAVVRGPWLLDFQPYAVLGAGYRYHDFTEEGFGQLTGNHGAFLGHLGLGVAWDVGRYELTLEGGRYFNRLLDSDQLRDADVQNPTFTVGLRIPIR